MTAAEKALAVIEKYGGFEGDHHRAWCIDQIARALTGAGYSKWVKKMKAGEDGPSTYDWDVGTPP